MWMREKRPLVQEDPSRPGAWRVLDAETGECLYVVLPGSCCTHARAQQIASYLRFGLKLPKHLLTGVEQITPVEGKG